MKIVVLTCVWKRPNITKIFLEQFKALQAYNPSEFELELVVVGSEAKSKEIVTPYTTHYIHYKNLPLGKKWNAGLAYCESLDFDVLLALGSDDIISTSCLSVYKRYIDEGFDYLGWQDFYLLDTSRKKMKYWSGYQGKRNGESVGAGRMFSRSLLEKLDFKLWDSHKNKGLDGSCTKKIQSIKHSKRVIRAKNNIVFMVDLKSKTNIGGYHRCDGNSVNMKRLILNHFGKNIYRMISKL